MKSLFHLLLVLSICSLSQAYVITFEDLPLGANYDAADSPINSGGVPIYISGSGSTTVQDDNLAVGTGYELWVSNVTLDFDFGITLQGLSLQYGEFGGTNILQINNVTQSTNDFSTLHGMDFNGAVVTVVNAGDTGAIFVTGPVNSFSISGQELAIDNVIACIPEPASLTFLGLGGLLLLRRRR